MYWGMLCQGLLVWDHAAVADPGNFKRFYGAALFGEP